MQSNSRVIPAAILRFAAITADAYGKSYVYYSPSAVLGFYVTRMKGHRMFPEISLLAAEVTPDKTSCQNGFVAEIKGK